MAGGGFRKCDPDHGLSYLGFAEQNCRYRIVADNFLQRRVFFSAFTGFRASNVRIVTWNCGIALARKAPSLLGLHPDIAVVQECSKKSVDVLHSHGFSGLWFGATPNKTWSLLQEGVRA